MNPSDPLAQLHPLREPGPIGWWPPAPGWWLLLALGVAALIALGWWLYRRHRRNAYRRLGLRHLDLIERQFRSDGDHTTAVQAINALLKGVALRAYPRRDIAAASGEHWQAFLAASAPKAPRFEHSALSAQYRTDASEVDIEGLARTARLWIQRHEVGQ